MKLDRLSELFPQGLEEIVGGVKTNEKLTIEISEKIGIVVKRETIMASEEPSVRPHLWEKIAIFVFGVVFLVVLLGIAIFVPNPTEFQLFVFRVVLALVSAAIAALVPGFLNIESQVYRSSIRAGGAIAVFVIVYLVNPPKLINPGPPRIPPESKSDTLSRVGN
jgi:VIT1/CCC1 family predicted Fe2+/Mn2+ transporter